MDKRGTFAYGAMDREWASCCRAAMVLYSAAVREVKIGMSQSHALQLVNFSAFLARLTEANLMNFVPSAFMAMSEVGKCLKSNITQASATMAKRYDLWCSFLDHMFKSSIVQDSATGRQQIRGGGRPRSALYDQSPRLGTMERTICSRLREWEELPSKPDSMLEKH